MRMKFFFLVAVVGCLSVCATAQTGELRGKVLDSKTSEALPFAHIFVNLTTLGTTSDAQGNYVLKNLPAGVHEVVFSFIGYTSYQTKVTAKAGESNTLDIRLVPLETQLETVVVSGTRDKEWEKQLKKFEKIFIGSTRSAAATKIKNPWALEFKESEVNHVNLFTATASQPIEIENNALGYRIEYHLKTFATTASGYNIAGQVRFEELNPQDARQAKLWSDNRNDAYYGSLRHLLTAIVTDRVAEEGFYIYVDKSGYENTPYRSSNFKSQIDKTIELYSTKNTVVAGKGTAEWTIPVKQRWEVHYTRARTNTKTYSDVDYPVSWIQVNGGSIRTTPAGIVLNPVNVVLSGAMNEARLAEMLPYNYTPGAPPQVSIESPTVVKLKPLEEKVYVHTDKGYYYPGEIMWLKAFLNYRDPQRMDTLSHVLYVELVDRNKKLIQSKTLFIDGGSGDGAMELPAHVPAGMYTLRAYTQWMLNYGQAAIFNRAIPLLNLDEKPAPGDSTIQLITPELKLRTKRTTYQPREKVKLEFELRDSEGVPIPGEFTVSVTDVNQAVRVPAPGIIDQFPMSDPTTAAWLTAIRYPIESGISLAGTYVNGKGKPARKTITLAQNKFERLVPFETDAQGQFWVSGLHFYDSAELGFQLVGTKKQEGTITLRAREIPTPGNVPSITLKTIKTSPYVVRRNEKPNDSRVLKEVVVEEAALPAEVKNKDQIPKAYGRADFTITHAEIVASSRTSLVDVLVGRVPGLVVVGNVLRFGSASNFMGPASTEPMLIIDGVQITAGGDSNYNRLLQINPEMVERVDVIKYGGAAIYGSRGSNGVIVVTTKSGIDQKASTESSCFQTIVIPGYAARAVFDAPDYSVKSDQGFDHRATVHWEPTVRMDEVFKTISCSFYAADVETTYQVEVIGVTDYGDPVRGTFFIDIKK
jgi:TonB-dependent SusC/RagA subfamily outer membrane receptor